MALEIFPNAIFGVGHTFLALGTPFFFGVGTPKMVLQHHFFFPQHQKILYIESGVPNAIFFPNTIFGVPTPFLSMVSFFGLILDTTPRRIEIFQFGSNHLKALVFFYDVLDFGFDTIIFRGFKNLFKKLI